MLNFLGDVIVNGNPDVKIINPNKKLIKPQVPKFDGQAAYPKGTKDLLTELGPEEFSKWLSKEKKIHYTDTTMRDAHQSLLATRMRTYDLEKVAKGFAMNHPEVLDRKSTRLNSSHVRISYAVFCSKKKNGVTTSSKAFAMFSLSRPTAATASWSWRFIKSIASRIGI